MRFALTDEQTMLRDAVRGTLDREVPLTQVRSWCETRQAGEPHAIAVRQGWVGIGSDESEGGQGGGLVEVALVAEELARAAVPGPFLAHLLSVSLLRALGRADALLGELVSGERSAAIAVPSGARLGTTHGELRLDGEELTGEITFVLSAPDVDLLLFPTGDTLVAVEAAAPGVELERLETTDLTRNWAHVRLTGARGRKLEGGPAGEALASIEPVATVLVAADALGVAQRMLDLTVAYAREREQFGTPIGSFQAVKHGAVDMLVDVEAMRSATYFAAWSVAARRSDAATVAAMAKALCTSAACRVADGALALHGAIGFTWEHDLQFFYKRAHADRPLFGSPGAHQDVVAEGLDLVPAVVPAG